MKNSLRFIPVILLILFAGCGDPFINMIVHSDTGLNPGERGEGLPVVIRFYELKDRVKFQNADFKSLWQNDMSILEDDMLYRHELTVFPSSSVTFQLNKYEEAVYIAVAAFFRKPQEARWKKIYKLLPSDSQKVQIVLEGSKVEVHMHEK